MGPAWVGTLLTPGVHAHKFASRTRSWIFASATALRRWLMVVDMGLAFTYGRHKINR